MGKHHAQWLSDCVTGCPCRRLPWDGILGVPGQWVFWSPSGRGSTAGRESADTDLDAREVDIDALLSRDQHIFAISELAVFVRCRIRSLFCVPSICAISTLQASSQNPPIPGLSRWHKAELAAKEFSCTKSLFRFFSGCCFAIARASRFRHRAERRSQSKAELAAPNEAPQQQVASR